MAERTWTWADVAMLPITNLRQSWHKSRYPDRGDDVVVTADIGDNIRLCVDDRRACFASASIFRSSCSGNVITTHKSICIEPGDAAKALPALAQLVPELREEHAAAMGQRND